MKTRKPASPISVWRPIDTDTFLFGAPHYPEHVDESYWERDAERMAEAGFNVVRMGEFAWHIFEPREGVFDFDLFDRAIAVLGKHGVKTIMCTPTATPPRWLTLHYPEVLRVDVNGRSMSHGSRQHADTCSPVYRTHSRRITKAMAEHYAGNPDVVGWQTDNELNTSMSVSYSDATRRAFQIFLEKKYESIEALNRAWGGDFWATAYGSFDQIVLPFDNAPVPNSPGHVLDYHRFLAHATAAFQHDQVEILRAANPGWFIFHNLGRLADIDFRGPFSTDLDFAGYDIYPLLYDEFERAGGLGATQAEHLDTCRGFSGNFIVPEQQSGFGSQPPMATLTPEPGEMRRMAYTSVSRGADGVMFFRWRPAHFGAEIYWMGIIDHDDIPRRRYAEVKQFSGEIAAMRDAILGTHVRMDVGIAGGDFDNQEAHKTYPMGLPSPADDARVLHRYCYDKGIACGFIHPEDDLSPLKVLYVPHWLIWKDEWTAKVEEFARNGGTVIFSARTGSRNADNHVIRETAPGLDLSRLAGVSVEEFGRLAAAEGDRIFDAPTNPNTPDFDEPTESSRRRFSLRIGNSEVVVSHMYEALELAEGTEALGQWSSRFLDGSPAISLRQLGKGKVIYMGTYLNAALMALLATEVLAKSGVEPLLPNLPQGVEVSLRQAEDRQLLFVLNTTAEPQRLPDLPPGIRLVSDLDHDNVLAGYGVCVLRLSA